MKIIYIFISILICSQTLFAQTNEEIKKSLDQIEKFTTQKSEKSVFSAEEQVVLEKILMQIAAIEKSNLKDDSKNDYTIELTDIISESYLKNKNIYKEIIKKLPLEQKKQLEELFKTIEDLEKKGNG